MRRTLGAGVAHPPARVSGNQPPRRCKFQKTLAWPFGGDHWPQHWPEINLNEQTFSSRLDNHQKEDLIECMYNQAAAQTEKHRKPAYQMRGQTCTLMQLRGYFGKSEKCIKNAVRSSKEYEEYAKKRSRPPQPPEMSLVDKCTELDRPSQEDEASAADAFDRTARQDASPAQVALVPGVAGEALSRGASTLPSPQSQGEPLPPLIALRPQCKRQLMRRFQAWHTRLHWCQAINPFLKYF